LLPTWGPEFPAFSAAYDARPRAQHTCRGPGRTEESASSVRSSPHTHRPQPRKPLCPPSTQSRTPCLAKERKANKPNTPLFGRRAWWPNAPLWRVAAPPAGPGYPTGSRNPPTAPGPHRAPPHQWPPATPNPNRPLTTPPGPLGLCPPLWQWANRRVFFPVMGPASFPMVGAGPSPSPANSSSPEFDNVDQTCNRGGSWPPPEISNPQPSSVVPRKNAWQTIHCPEAPYKFFQATFGPFNYPKFPLPSARGFPPPSARGQEPQRRPRISSTMLFRREWLTKPRAGFDELGLPISVAFFSTLNGSRRGFERFSQELETGSVHRPELAPRRRRVFFCANACRQSRRRPLLPPIPVTTYPRSVSRSPYSILSRPKLSPARPDRLSQPTLRNAPLFLQSNLPPPSPPTRSRNPPTRDPCSPAPLNSPLREPAAWLVRLA